MTRASAVAGIRRLVRHRRRRLAGLRGSGLGRASAARPRPPPPAGKATPTGCTPSRLFASTACSLCLIPDDFCVTTSSEPTSHDNRVGLVHRTSFKNPTPGSSSQPGLTPQQDLTDSIRLTFYTNHEATDTMVRITLISFGFGRATPNARVRKCWVSPPSRHHHHHHYYLAPIATGPPCGRRNLVPTTSVALDECGLQSGMQSHSR